MFVVLGCSTGELRKELVELVVFPRVVERGWIDVDAESGGGAEFEGCESEDAAAAADIEDRLAADPILHEFEHEAGGWVGEVAKSRSGMEQKG